ncbi:hypothetical protein [Spiroplasma phoeniceum]|nr:hypothetical protein [Spiroplasma phoeniceum]
MKKPLKTIKELISRTNQEYESMICSQEYFRQYEEIEIEDDITQLLPVRNKFYFKIYNINYHWWYIRCQSIKRFKFDLKNNLK